MSCRCLLPSRRTPAGSAAAACRGCSVLIFSPDTHRRLSISPPSTTPRLTLARGVRLGCRRHSAPLLLRLVPLVVRDLRLELSLLCPDDSRLYYSTHLHMVAVASRTVCGGRLIWSPPRRSALVLAQVPWILVPLPPPYAARELQYTSSIIW
jgi:hypothetical protein